MNVVRYNQHIAYMSDNQVEQMQPNKAQLEADLGYLKRWGATADFGKLVNEIEVRR